ncbi:Thiol:disulfide interchange protein [Syntrophobacter sp. SbD1]|nr:Thiol:disulfide interchange protein [Syntrophobacter sp. SbD1]
MKKLSSVLMPIGQRKWQKVKGKGFGFCLSFLLFTFAFTGVLYAADILGEVKALPVVKSVIPPQVELLEARDIGSLYEIVIKDPERGKQIYYVTKDGAYLIAGGIINKDKVNLTQVRHDEITRVDVSKLPLKDAIVIKRGNGAKKLIMFDDVDCPFCKRAYDWLKGQTNYTLYLFFFPLDMHPHSAEKSVKILCGKNYESAIEKAEADQEIDTQKCEAGEKMLARHKAIGVGIGVDSTPLFITDTGTRIVGLQVLALESYLKN